MKMTGVFLDIHAERQRQDHAFGPEHDDRLNTVQLCAVIGDYVGWARQNARAGKGRQAREKLIQIAALAVAAVESLDRQAAASNPPPTPQERIQYLEALLGDPDFYRMGEKKVAELQQELRLLRGGATVEDAHEKARDAEPEE